jgi:DNA-binding FadR family transcriptional regulator
LEILTTILERTERLMYVELRAARPQRTGSVAFHQPIVDAIRRPDPEAARKAVQADIREAQTMTLGDIGKLSSHIDS